MYFLIKLIPVTMYYISECEVIFLKGDFILCRMLNSSISLAGHVNVIFFQGEGYDGGSGNSHG